jgi:hypothetical protein
MGGCEELNDGASGLFFVWIGWGRMGSSVWVEKNFPPFNLRRVSRQDERPLQQTERLGSKASFRSEPIQASPSTWMRTRVSQDIK